MPAQHNVFMPHRHEDDAHIQKLKDLLARNGCDVRDSSIDSSKPNNATADGYIKSLLADNIRWAGKILVLISPDTKNHPWVDWEIEYANRFQDKRLIGIYLPGAGLADVPEPLTRHGDAVVSWNADAIIRAIEGEDNWQQPDGSAVTPHEIRRLSC